MADLSFHDAVAWIVGLEIHAARKSAQEDRGAEAVTVLAELLGKAVAVVCGGDPKATETLLTELDALIAETATSTGRALSILNGKGRA
jgi:hypothetical protein